MRKKSFWPRGKDWFFLGMMIVLLAFLSCGGEAPPMEEAAIVEEEVIEAGDEPLLQLPADGSADRVIIIPDEPEEDCGGEWKLVWVCDCGEGASNVPGEGCVPDEPEAEPPEPQ